MLMIVFCIVGYLLVQGMLTVPWVRTNRRMSRKMLELLNFQRGDRVLDLGSGDGSIVFEAVAMGGEGIGVERLGLLVWYARVLARMKNMQRKAKFIHGNILQDPLPQASLVTCYLFTEVNRKLEPRLCSSLPVGTRVVSRDFTFPTLHKIHSQPFGGSILYVYEV